MRKILAFFAAAVLFLALAGSAFAAEKPSEGTIGGISWRIIGDTLYIEGEGVTPDFSEDALAPWSENDDIKSVEVAEGITEIGNFSFFGMNITNITLPETLIGIGVSAFENCKYIAEIDLPETVEYLGYCAFLGCESLEKLDLSHIKEFYEGDFSGLNLKGEVVIEAMDKIPRFAFQDCPNITALRTSARIISQSSFDGCRNLTTLIFEEGVEGIDTWAFSPDYGYGQRDLTVYLPSTIKWIGYEAFPVILHKPSGSVTYYNGCQGMWDKIYFEKGNVIFDGLVSNANLGKIIVLPHEPDENGICALCGEEVPPISPGDVNGDGSVTLDDAILALKVAMNVDIGGETFIPEAADVISDGETTLDDAIAVLKLAMNVSV